MAAYIVSQGAGRSLRREAEAIRIGAGQPGAVPTSASYNFITGIDRAETVGYSISY